MENAETKLAVDYEAIRRREYELITNLLDVLPKVDNLPEERIAQVRDALFHADHPYLMVFVGPFSSGKSSIINALLGQGNLLPVGVTPTTDRISILRWGEEAQTVSAGGEVDTIFHPSPLLKKVSFVDTPGLESVFQKHEETTRRFLHRSDVVLLVMLATQAMTARNLEYLQTLKDYGKKVIIVINQVDLLTPEETETVKAYVQEQSKSVLGVVPEIWLISAKKGLAAGQGEARSEGQWEASGLAQIEAYIDEQLGDVDRMRQKLRTPLQITQNVNHAALEAVRANQGVLDQYQNISDNIEQQLASQRREQERIIQGVSDEISGKFGTAAMSGSEAIRDVFSLSRSFGSLWRGMLEMVGLGGLGRGGQPYITATFNRYQAFKPIDELSAVVDKLGPRLEGKDIQDIDDLVKYAQREIQQLPGAIRDKVIGQVQSPLKYEREHLQKVRSQLDVIENEARVVETERLEQTLRNTLLYLVVYEILVIVVGFFFSQAFAQTEQLLLVFIVVLGLVLLGLAIVPLRGRLLESSYTQHMLDLQRRYLSLLESAAEKQVAYGMQLRQDAIAPLTRLIEAQTKIQTGQLDKLLSAQQEMTNIEAALSKMGKRNLLVR